MAARRGNRKRLMACPVNAFEGRKAYAVTLTLGDCPASPGDYDALLERYVRKLKRALGVRHYYAVVEWQPRLSQPEKGGVPHAHFFVVFDEEVPRFRNPESYFGDGGSPFRRSGESGTLFSWLVVPWKLIAGTRYGVIGRRLQRDYGVNLEAQHAAAVHAVAGWFEYLAVHGGLRGDDPQRARESMPPSWRGESCRVWRCDSRFPRVGPEGWRVSRRDIHLLRRRLRARAVSEARARVREARTARAGGAARRELSRARRMLSGSGRSVSSVRGLTRWRAGGWILRGLMAWDDDGLIKGDET